MMLHSHGASAGSIFCKTKRNEFYRPGSRCSASIDIVPALDFPGTRVTSPPFSGSFLTVAAGLVPKLASNSQPRRSSRYCKCTILKARTIVEREWVGLGTHIP